jgi:peptidoglycan/LPS O-acetylase OafA/YrhL
MPPKTNQRHFGLDMIRALAILSVVFGHSMFILKPIIPTITSFPYLRGVDVFFVLSGYLIGTRFLQQNQKDKGVHISYGNRFLKHAAWRILPMYFLFLLINLATALILFPEELTISRVVPAFFFLQNVYSPHIGFFWESWSLPITVWFYVLLTFGFIWIGRKFQPHQIKFRLLLFIILLLLIPLIIRIYVHLTASLDFFWWDVKIRKFLPARMDAPFYGFLAAWIRFYYPKWFKSLRIPGFLIAVGLYLWYYLYTPAAGTIGKDIIYLITSPLTYALLLPTFMYLKRAPALIAKPITWISLISYALYLVNLLIVIIFQKTGLFEYFNAVNGYIFYWGVTLFTAWFFYNFYEIKIRKQFDKWKKNGILFKFKS